MSDMSSDEDLEPVNVFQKARTGNLKRRPAVPQSPRRSPRAAQSPSRKTRRTEPHYTEEIHEEVRVADSAAVIIPPRGWLRPGGSPTRETAAGSPAGANPFSDGIEPDRDLFSPSSAHLRAQNLSPRRARHGGSPVFEAALGNVADHSPPKLRPGSPRIPDSPRVPDSPSVPSSSRVPSSSPSGHDKMVSRPFMDPVEPPSRSMSQSPDQHADTIEELLMPSSEEGLNPEQLEAIFQQLRAGVAGADNANVETLSLEQFAIEGGLRLEPVEGLAEGESLEASGEPDMGVELEVAGKLSRIEKVEAAVLAAAIRRLREKMDKESKALAVLRDTKVSRGARLVVPVQSLWDSAHLRGEFAKHRAEFRRLRDLRIQLMQQLNDLKHEQSQAHASSKVYARLREQIQESESLIGEYAASAAEADQMSHDIKQTELALATELEEYRSAEAKLRANLNSVQAVVLSRINKVEGPAGQSQDTGEHDLEAARRRVAHLSKSLDASVRTDATTGYVSTPFLTIRIDLDTGHKRFAWSYPQICREVYDHYRGLLESKPHRSVRELLGLWRRGLAVHGAFMALLGRGSFVSVEANPETEMTNFELFDIKLGRALHVHLQGELVVSQEELPELAGL